MDHFTGLNVFVHAAEARSFTEAGRQLGISSSAVGKAVARLEERLAVRLFHRSTRSISLTQEGAVFLESCRRIFSEMEVAELELAQIKRAPSGVLRVSLPLVGMLLMPTLAKFITAFPEVELDLDFTDHMVNVIEDGFDVVVRSGDVSDSRLMARSLGTYTHRLVGSPAYFARAGTPQKPEDLQTHACLQHKYPTVGKLKHWPLMQEVAGLDLELPRTVVASTLEPLIHLAEAGLGITCVPDFTVSRQLAEGTLVSVLDEFIRHSGMFRAVWPSSRYLAPKVRCFVDFLAEHLFPKPADTSTV